MWKKKNTGSRSRKQVVQRHIQLVDCFPWPTQCLLFILFLKYCRYYKIQKVHIIFQTISCLVFFFPFRKKKKIRCGDTQFCIAESVRFELRQSPLEEACTLHSACPPALYHLLGCVGVYPIGFCERTKTIKEYP